MPDGRDRALRRGAQGLFALALAWTFYWLAAWLVGREFDLLNPAPVGSRLRDLFAAWVPVVVATAVAIGATLLAARRWPGFLRVPEKVALPRVLVTLAVALPVVAIGLLVLLGIVGLALDPPPWPTDNPQYIPLVFWLAPLGTIVLAPLATVGAAWWWLRRRRAGLSAT
jgi:hypothetical protein